MAYSNFTLEAVQKTFQLEMVQSIGIFSETEQVNPSSELSKALAKKVPLAVAIGTEKAKSEMIVADILVELREHFEHRISLFSGIDFNVDTENDLTGVCNFLVSLSQTSIIWSHLSSSSSKRNWISAETSASLTPLFFS